MRFASFEQQFRGAALTAIAAVALTSTVAGAQVTPGSRLSFSGVADATDLGRPGVLLDFQGPVTAAKTGNTGSFKSLNTKGAAVSGSLADFIVGRGPQPISSFLKLGGYTFDLVSLPSGIFGQRDCYVEPRPGQLCTPYQSELGDPRPTDPLSPFFMANIPTGDPDMPIASIIGFNVVGTVRASRGTTMSFFGTITSTLPFSYQEVLAGLEGAGSVGLPLESVPFEGVFYAGLPVVASHGRASTFASADALSAQLVTPEPATFALLGAGLAVVGIVGARRRRQ